MKILFISFSLSHGFYGGAIGSRRNYDSICSLFGKDNVIVHKLDVLPSKTIIDKMRKVVSKVLFLSDFTSSIFKSTSFHDYDIVFLDSTLLGIIAKKLRKENYRGKIISFFHNCEFDLFSQMIKDKSIISRLLTKRFAKMNEMYSLKYSDKCAALNNRDIKRIKELYGYEVACKIPVSIPDTVAARPGLIDWDLELHDKLKLIFVGSNFFPNIQGIKWFVENVYPYVNIDLVIVGKGMDVLRKSINNPQIQILSDVPDLTTYILDADFVLLPILMGSGMKLKTCESLMYGKNIIGTTESFQGYEVEDYNKIGALCDKAEDFINAINSIDRSSFKRFNKCSRQLYLEKYSFDSTLHLFAKLLG